MIEIDDAGGGCPILGELFLIRHVVNDQWESIYVNNENRKTEFISKAIYEKLHQMDPHKKEEIHLCQGSLFNHLEQVLSKEGWKVKRTKIIGKTNDLAEDIFQERLESIGLPKHIQLKGRDYKEYYDSILTWYFTCYDGPNILKQPIKKSSRTYLFHNVYDCPNLLTKLLEANEE